jgi:hypothetical protein
MAPRLGPLVTVAPGGIGNGTAFVLFGGVGYLSASYKSSEVALWDVAASTFQRLTVNVRGVDVAVVPQHIPHDNTTMCLNPLVRPHLHWADYHGRSGAISRQRRHPGCCLK